MICAGNDPIAALWVWEENEQTKQVWECPPAWQDWCTLLAAYQGCTWVMGLDPTVKLGIFLNMPGLGDYLKAAKSRGDK